MRSWPSPYLPPALSGVDHPSLQLVDSYTNERFSFENNLVTTYVCGITPYDATHLGHAATYLSFDLVHRYLLASGKKLQTAQNITDIDDPLLERANRDHVNWQDLAVDQVELFQRDMTALRVIPPDSYRGVVESMDSIISDIQELVSKGLTYNLEGDIYLQIESIPTAIEDLPTSIEEAIAIFAERGGDPKRIGKHHPLDTLLWLAARPGEPSWDAPFGAGRPGWHIECLSIARNNLPALLDTCLTLQGGGSDLIFPHHYMTNVQSLALTGKKFAAVYSHSGMIGLDGDKMSKSKGNLLFVSKLLESGLRAEAIRLALISRHYRSDTMWHLERFDAATLLLDRIERNLARETVAPTRPIIERIVKALANNLDTPAAIEAIKDWCSATESGETGGVSGELSRALDLYLGITI